MLLWPFNKYPGTDYETFNWEWILKTVKEWATKMNVFTETITAEWDAMQADWQTFIDDTYKEQITEILADHPEWTTTVMNGSITEPKINATFLKTIKNAYVTPEMYGAVGDGVTDDTEAIRQAANNAEGLPVVFGADKTYIINIEPGTTTHDRRVFFDNPKTHMLIGDNSTIKLGTDNGNIAAYKGFESIFRWEYNDSIVYIYGLTFDYNNAENPVIHTEWTAGGTNVEMNSQQLAIAVYYSNGLKVSNCRFLDYAGTNVINYRHNNAAECVAEITFCEFRGGNAAKYNGANVYHDHSSISLHKDNRSSATVAKMICTVAYNIFEGLDGNAYNPCECSADEFNYDHNTIINYEIGVLLLTRGNNNIQNVTNNIIRGAGIGIAIFGQYADNGNSGGFEEINISNNYIGMDIYRSITTPCFTKTLKENGYYLGEEHHAIGNSSYWNEDIHHLNIVDNIIEFINQAQVPADGYFTGYDGACIGFTYAQTSETEPVIDYIDIRGNNIYNSPSLLYWDVSTYVTKTMKVCDNLIKNPWSRAGINPAYINDGLIVKSGKNGAAYVDNTFILNNMVEYPYASNVYACVWLKSANAFGDGHVVIANQNVSKKPYYNGINNTGSSTTMVENSVWIP